MVTDERGLHAGAPERLGDLCIRQSLSRPVPSNDRAFADRKGPVRLTIRAARRALALRWSAQVPTLCDRIDASWQRVLWPTRACRRWATR